MTSPDFESGTPTTEFDDALRQIVGRGAGCWIDPRLVVLDHQAEDSATWGVPGNLDRPGAPAEVVPEEAVEGGAYAVLVRAADGQVKEARLGMFDD